MINANGIFKKIFSIWKLWGLLLWFLKLLKLADSFDFLIVEVMNFYVVLFYSSPQSSFFFLIFFNLSISEIRWTCYHNAVRQMHLAFELEVTDFASELKFLLLRYYHKLWFNLFLGSSCLGGTLRLFILRVNWNSAYKCSFLMSH